SRGFTFEYASFIYYEIDHEIVFPQRGLRLSDAAAFCAGAGEHTDARYASRAGSSGEYERRHQRAHGVGPEVPALLFRISRPWIPAEHDGRSVLFPDGARIDGADVLLRHSVHAAESGDRPELRAVVDAQAQPGRRAALQHGQVHQDDQD